MKCDPVPHSKAIGADTVLGLRRPHPVVAVVQARMGSTRLAGKVLAEIERRPLLWHVVRRAAAAQTIDRVVVATSDQSSDSAIADWCQREGVACIRGSESDVLDRFLATARATGARTIVRVTADCPLLDPEVVDLVVSDYLSGDWDYASNTIHPTHPDGLDVEVFSMEALELAWRESKSPSEREHVTPFMRTSGQFRTHSVQAERDLSHLRWCVDEPQDLQFVRAVYKRLRPQTMFGTRAILDVVEGDPGLTALNTGFTRNAGSVLSLVKEEPMEPLQRTLEQCRTWTARAERLIPSRTQTFSKGPTQFVQGPSPTFVARASGARVWDADGNEYLDWAMALGAVILGYAYPPVNTAVTRQVDLGASFTLPHTLEVELAEKLVELIPCAEMVRFGKNGSDVTSGAVRLARAFTGRDMVACSGYHGWQDWFIGSTTRNAGVPQAIRDLTVTFAYNDLDSLDQLIARHRGQLAAIVMEPVGVVEPEPGFLAGVRERATRIGAVLVFDEVVTGFRLSRGGAQELYGVTPDIACFGKAMGNGLPVAALVGRRDIMEHLDEVFFSFTFGGEAVSLAAAKATIEVMCGEDVIAHIWAQGRTLRDGYNVLAHECGLAGRTRCIGLPPRHIVTFTDDTGAESLLLKSLFQQECVKRGLLFTGGHNVSYSHGEAEVEQTLRVYRAAMSVLAEAIERDDVGARLEGPPVSAVFRKA